MTHFLGLGPTTKRTKARRGLFVRPEAFFVSIDKKTKRASTFRKLTKSTVQYSTVQYRGCSSITATDFLSFCSIVTDGMMIIWAL